jgi:hypothetical protein
MTIGFLATCVPGLGVVALFDFWSERLRRRTLRRYCSEIEASSIPAAVGDKFARLWCVNRAFLRTLGHHSAADVRGRWLFEFLEDTEHCAAIYRSLQSDRQWEGRLWTRRQAAAYSREIYVKVTPCPKTNLVRWHFIAPGGTAPGWPAGDS